VFEPDLTPVGIRSRQEAGRPRVVVVLGQFFLTVRWKGWTPELILSALSDEEMRQIEFEENEDRKSLTAARAEAKAGVARLLSSLA
jgi:hypothetical protein